MYSRHQSDTFQFSMGLSPGLAKPIVNPQSRRDTMDEGLLREALLPTNQDVPAAHGCDLSYDDRHTSFLKSRNASELTN